MIEIRYSEEGVDLQGTPAELRAIRQAVLDFLTNDQPFVRLAASTDFDPAPYIRHLESLIIRKGPGAAKVTVSGGSLDVEGEPAKLKTFAEWFDFTDEGPSRYHCHLEYYGGSSWIASESVPLAISVHRPDAA